MIVRLYGDHDKYFRLLLHLHGEFAFHIIEESLGSHFDLERGKVFIGCREQLTEYYDKQFISSALGFH